MTGTAELVCVWRNRLSSRHITVTVAVDRQAVNLTPEDVLRVITSAGCNVLD
jgi:hypothetical protein